MQRLELLVPPYISEDKGGYNKCERPIARIINDTTATLLSGEVLTWKVSGRCFWQVQRTVTEPRAPRSQEGFARKNTSEERRNCKKGHTKYRPDSEYLNVMHTTWASFVDCMTLAVK